MSTFLKQIFSNPVKTGGIAPCGPEVVKLVIERGDWANASTVVEFGPGTGVFTREIVKRLSPEAKFLALEINPDFVEASRKVCPEANIYHESAENIGNYLDKDKSEKCDIIVSTLPWSILDIKLVRSILDNAVENMRPGGVFLNVGYAHSRHLPGGKKFIKELNQRFAKVERSKKVWNKYLPMVMMACTK